MPQRGAPAPRGRGPSARRQRWEMAIGILGFFTVVAFIVTVVAEVRGEPALNEAIVLAGFVLLTYLAYRAWQRSD